MYRLFSFTNKVDYHSIIFYTKGTNIVSTFIAIMKTKIKKKNFTIYVSYKIKFIRIKYFYTFSKKISE